MNSNIDSLCIEISTKEEDSASIKENLGFMLFDSLKKYRSRVLQYIADTDETDTYEEVLIRSIRTALKLKEKGIGKGDIISTCSPNQKHSCIPVLAAFFLGAIPTYFDPNLSHLDTIHLLKLLEPTIVFVSQKSVAFMEKCLTESKSTTELVVFGESTIYDHFDEYLKPHPEEETFKPTPIYDSRETAVILFSSGTTGLPKGICLSHHAIIQQISNENLFMFIKDENQYVSLMYTTLYWISGMSCLIETILSGNARAMCEKFVAYEAWRIIEKYKVLCIFLQPHYASEFVHHRPKDVDVSSLKFFITGSFPPTKQLMEDLRTALPYCTVRQGYGQTEATSCMCRFDITQPEDVEMQNKKPLSCGKIRPGFLWKIVDPDTETVLGPNQRGELRIKNDFLMNGYYKMDTSSAFDSDGYLKTGDIVYYDEEDCFYVVDRIKEVFKYKGWHILPAVLENVLMSHPAVKEAAVIGVPHELDGEHAMGVVVLYDEFKDVTSNEIENFVEERVPEIQRLRAGVKIVNELVKTTTGKVRRRVLKNMVLEREI